MSEIEMAVWNDTIHITVNMTLEYLYNILSVVNLQLINYDFSLQEVLVSLISIPHQFPHLYPKYKG